MYYARVVCKIILEENHSRYKYPDVDWKVNATHYAVLVSGILIPYYLHQILTSYIVVVSVFIKRNLKESIIMSINIS